MEPAPEAPWAEHEKVYLLAEILKASPISSSTLFGILRDFNIHPNWNETALPPGRSLRSCRMAYESMPQTLSTPDYRHRPQLPAPPTYPGSDIAKKRPLPPETTPPIGRLLQPRPPHAYGGEFMSQSPYPIQSPVGASEPASKKKRGRPTKAEAQARADAAAARGEPYPLPRKSRTSVTGPELPSGEARPSGETPPASIPAASMAAHTPQQPQAERGSESSSGKKKRKPTPLELEKPHREPRETESPLAFSATGGLAYSSFTPISAPLPSASEPRDRDRDVRMEGVEESQPRTTTPHSFKDTVGI